jgi:alpha-mannosidase
MAHHGCWRAAGVDSQAEQLNNPLVGAMVRGTGAAAIADGWQAADVRCAGAAHMEIAALKPAESAGAVALRMVEVRGGAGEVRVRWGFPVEAVHAADLFEQPAEIAGFGHDAASGTTTFTVRPFQIVTLRAELAGGVAG